MPPIPKFAKEIVKRAKAKPKVIKTSIAVKKATNAKPRKTDTIRKEKIKKELKQSFTDKLSDNLNLMALTKELKSVKTDDLKGNADKISEYIKKFKNFLDIVIASLKPDDSAIDMFNELSGALDKIDATKVESIPTSIRKIASKIHKEAKKRS